MTARRKLLTQEQRWKLYRSLERLATLAIRVGAVKRVEILGDPDSEQLGIEEMVAKPRVIDWE